MSVLLESVSDVDPPPSRETLAYFNLYPDVAKAFSENNYNLSADEFARIHYDTYGKYEQRAPVEREQLLDALPTMSQEQQRAALSEAFRDVGQITRAEHTDPAWQQDPFYRDEHVSAVTGNTFYPHGEGSYVASLTAPFDQPGPGGQYGSYVGTFDPSGRLQNIDWRQEERHGGWLSENPELAVLLATGAGLAASGALAGGTLGSAAAGTPELVVGGGAYAGAAPTASLPSLSTAAGFVEGAGEMFVTDFMAANNAVNTVASNPVMTAIADATPQVLESMASNAGTSFNVPGINEAISNVQQVFNQGQDFLRNMWNDIGSTLLPDAPAPVQRAVGEVAVRTAATGGDFEQALQDTGLSFLTSGLGSQVAEVTGSPMAGRIASNAAQQYARTGTVDPAQLAAGEATRFLQGQVSQTTGSPLIGNLAASAARDVMAGRDPSTGLISVGAGALLNQAGSTLDRFLPSFGQPSGGEGATQAPIEARTTPPPTITESVFGRSGNGIGLRDVAAGYLTNQLQQQATGGPRNVVQPPPRGAPTGNPPPMQVDISTLQRVGPGGAAPTGAPPATTTPTGQAPTGQIQTGQGNITQAATPITGAASLSDILATMRT